ncbi:MAG: cellulose biosynthesis cyclic di-GMP-binding regulatory protein BcsB [Hyphomicrobiaceae bacterium]|nr:cellulose biosynthesis cyclic di-GMP-binding regulatory protein BcsB [Hyphomicrobiaceae bacterium]
MFDHRSPRLALVLATLAATGLSAAPSRAAEVPARDAALLGAKAVAQDPSQALRRLPVTIRAPRLAGETDSLEWPVYLTDADAGGPVSLRLTYRSAVSVMPEASRLKITVNGRAIEPRRLESAPNRRVLDIELPAASIAPGWNAIRVAADQRHRVDCSLASTYELWTEIDESASGLVTLGGRAPMQTVGDIATALPDATGATRIRLVVSRQATAEEVAVASQAANTVALLGGFQHPLIEVAPELGAGPGIDVVMGGRREGVSIERSPEGRPIVSIGGTTRADWQQGVEALVAHLERRPGAPEGLAVLGRVGGQRVSSNQSIAFGEVGHDNSEFGGRVFRTAMDVVLPADFYPAAYGKAKVRLAGGYRGGLDPNARIVVRVNGEISAGLPLALPAGELFRDRTIGLPLFDFRPGPNRIEIDAQLPSAADRDCDTLSQLDQPPRFLFLNQTTVEFPTLARATRYPDLAATAGGAVGDGLAVYVPHPDADSVSAAATLMARFSLTAGKPLASRFQFRAPAADAGVGLVVGGHLDMPTSTLASVGLVPEAFRKAWALHPGSAPTPGAQPGGNGSVRVSQQLDQLDRRVAAIRMAQMIRPDDIVTGSITPSAPTRQATQVGQDLYQSWQSSLHKEGWLEMIQRRLTNLASHVAKPVVDVIARANDKGIAAPESTTGLVFAQARVLDGALTLVTAPNSKALSENVAQVVDPLMWTRLAGRSAAYDTVEMTLTTTATPAASSISPTVWSTANLRLVSAGWLSENPLFFGLLAILASIALGIATHLVVRRSGVRV